mmetsp:Transcript_13872/g.25102  ORF Transcript_13872/g.25102 Transcript_13872/m.25102 type:complete len:634 (-) Transcript_13872:111-2012(-)
MAIDDEYNDTKGAGYRRNSDTGQDSLQQASPEESALNSSSSQSSLTQDGTLNARATSALSLEETKRRENSHVSSPRHVEYVAVEQELIQPEVHSIVRSDVDGIHEAPTQTNSHNVKSAGLPDSYENAEPDNSSQVRVVTVVIPIDEEDTNDLQQQQHTNAKVMDSFVLRNDLRNQIIAVIAITFLAFIVTLAVVACRPASSTRVPMEEGTMYVQVGSSLYGPEGDLEDGTAGQSLRFGSSVSMSGDGNRIAIGAPYYSPPSGLGSEHGLVQVFEDQGRRDDGKEGNSTSWKLLEAATVVGDSAGYLAGTSVTMSLDGKTLVVGFPTETTGMDQWLIRVYRENLNLMEGDDVKQWTQIGESFSGFYASSIAVSKDGNIVAFSLDTKGVVFEYMADQDEWVQLGRYLDDVWFQSGTDPFSMSADGTTVVVGALSTQENHQKCQLQIHEYNNNNGIESDWNPMGSNIELDREERACDALWATSMSSDGRTVAVVSSHMNVNIMEQEKYELLFQVFRYNETVGEWAHLGQNQYAKYTSYLHSYDIALSGDGTTLVIGNPAGFVRGANSGHVQVLRLENDDWVPVGKELEGSSVGDMFGFSVAVSIDGKRIGVGAPRELDRVNYGTERGRVTVYDAQE